MTISFYAMVRQTPKWQLFRALYRVVSQADEHQHPWHVEGEANAEWVLIDYVDVVVHIFQTRLRAHYDLEGLWGDAKIINLETNY